MSTTHDRVIAKGVLNGLSQASDFAELIACKEAVTYAVLNQGDTTIWIDSAPAATGLHRLLINVAVPRQIYMLMNGIKFNIFVLVTQITDRDYSYSSTAN